MSTRTYFIRTFGCQMNEHDSERAAGVLETMGYRPAADPASADLVLFNTCAIRENADNKLYGQLSMLKPLKLADPSKTVVVGGCLAQKDQGRVAEKAPWVDVVYGTHNMGALPQLLAQADSAALPVVEILEHTEMFPSALPARREVAHHAWVSISIGCDNTCTFCIVPRLRGPEKSRKLGDIVAEVRALVADGVREVTLLGQNVNSYGRDLVRAGLVPADGRRNRTLFAELLHTLGEIEGLWRIRFTSPHPKDFSSDVFAAIRDVPSVCEQLHLPLQSGSDRILRRMQRSYRSRRYLELVAEARETIPGVAISTDIIVGFPGETADDFADTLAVTSQAQFDAAYTFEYSRRPGTAAVDLDGHVDPAVVNARYRRLAALTRELSAAGNARQVGTVAELLIEGPSKTDPDKVSGRTRTNRLVHVPGGPYTAVGSLVHARLTHAASYYLLGEVAPDQALGPVAAGAAGSSGWAGSSGSLAVGSSGSAVAASPGS
ncbi:MAG: tRNA (N6-isopentenyl adenosine(37)-C2)-methylthiotransferase MiaB [Actinomycetota bacterium]|nr:tRNA (N6-isopentenyl adenosine(37)-C2)-methylthiotransferase MiaB [Euzebyaceae bacterium]MDQ3453746.1 tRNA (N6-isopentenyl adenosine(37)-C2)-methylthiotransferase MiaB [Actinomycetota bacterium]